MKKNKNIIEKELFIGVIPNEEEETVDIVAMDDNEEIIAVIGYICSKGILHLIADENLEELGFNVDDDGFINIVWDGIYNENEYIH